MSNYYENVIKTLSHFLSDVETPLLLESIKDYEIMNPEAIFVAAISCDLCENDEQKKELEKLLLKIKPNLEFHYSEFVKRDEIFFKAKREHFSDYGSYPRFDGSITKFREAGNPEQLRSKPMDLNKPFWKNEEILKEPGDDIPRLLPDRATKSVLWNYPNTDPNTDPIADMNAILPEGFKIK